MESHHEHYSEHRWEILQKLHERNKKERKRYEDVVHLTNNLYELIDFHQKENRRLIVTNAKLENELEDGTDRSSSTTAEKSSVGRRHTILQEEFADLFKQKGELAQQVICLRNSVDEKEKELATKNAKIQELEAQLTKTEELLKQTQQKLADTEQNHQFIKDEYEALHITYSSMEEKKQKLEKENQDLITRLIELKAIHADKMNEETELFQRLGKVFKLGTFK